MTPGLPSTSTPPPIPPPLPSKGLANHLLCQSSGYASVDCWWKVHAAGRFSVWQCKEQMDAVAMLTLAPHFRALLYATATETICIVGILLCTL